MIRLNKVCTYIVSCLFVIFLLTTNSNAITDDVMNRTLEKINKSQEKCLTGNIEAERLELEEEKKQQVEKEMKELKIKRIKKNTSVKYSKEDYIRGAKDIMTIKNVVNKTKPPEDIMKLINSTIRYVGKPYVWGGDDIRTPNHAYDCSGFTKSIYSKLGYTLPRTAAGQKNKIEEVIPNKARMGDLIFFKNTYPTNEASHVGIYLGNKYMIHASSGKGYITVDNITQKYWINHFYGFGRVIVR